MDLAIDRSERIWVLGFHALGEPTSALSFHWAELLAPSQYSSIKTKSGESGKRSKSGKSDNNNLKYEFRHYAEAAAFASSETSTAAAAAASSAVGSPSRPASATGGVTISIPASPETSAKNNNNNTSAVITGGTPGRHCSSYISESFEEPAGAVVTSTSEKSSGATNNGNHNNGNHRDNPAAATVATPPPVGRITPPLPLPRASPSPLPLSLPQQPEGGSSITTAIASTIGAATATDAATSATDAATAAAAEPALPAMLLDRYELGPILGKGGFAYVREGLDRQTGDRVAVKIIQRSTVKTSAELSIRREVKILSMLNHPNIVRTFNFYEEIEYFYMVLECINGGALFDRIKLRTVFTETQVRELAFVLLSAIKHCHDRNIVHR